MYVHRSERGHHLGVCTYIYGNGDGKYNDDIFNCLIARYLVMFVVFNRLRGCNSRNNNCNVENCLFPIAFNTVAVVLVAQ